MKTLFWKKIFFNSRSDFAKSRSAIYSVSSKAVMIKQCNAITTKNEFSLYRKSRENRAEKRDVCMQNRQNTFHPTCSCDFQNGPREPHCRNIFYITETPAESPCSHANFPLQYYVYTVPVNVSKFKAADTYFHQRIVS